MWDSDTRKAESRFNPGIGTAVYTYVSPDRNYIATACPGLTLIRVDTDKVVKRLLPDMVQRAVFTPDSRRLIAPNETGELVVWLTSDGSEERRIKVSDAGVVWVAVSPSGHLIAATDGAGTLHLFDGRSGKKLRAVELEKPGTEDSGFLVAFTRDRRHLVAASFGGRIKVLGSGR